MGVKWRLDLKQNRLLPSKSIGCKYVVIVAGRGSAFPMLREEASVG